MYTSTIINGGTCPGAYSVGTRLTYDSGRRLNCRHNLRKYPSRLKAITRGSGMREASASRVGVTRRRLLTAAGVIIGSAVLVEAVLSRRTTQFKLTMTTLFWVGEPSNADNAFIPNDKSYWDQDWQARYGGVDDPEHRNGHWPVGFRPKENPFYVALPFGEFIRGNEVKREAQRIPWYRPELSPLLKNRWVEVRRGGRSCYAQWQDVGPNGEDDFDFVFGRGTKPRNTFDAKAGLDMSPAVWNYLGMNDNELTAWRFADAAEVPQGPWTEIVTTSGNNRISSSGGA
jgi:hypothetical protein